MGYTLLGARANWMLTGASQSDVATISRGSGLKHRSPACRQMVVALTRNSEANRCIGTATATAQPQHSHITATAHSHSGDDPIDAIIALLVAGTKAGNKKKQGRGRG